MVENMVESGGGGGGGEKNVETERPTYPNEV